MNAAHNQTTGLPGLRLSPTAEACFIFNAAADDGVFPAGIIAHVLDLSVSTLAKMRSEGAGPAYHPRGYARYYRKADVLEWMMKERRVT